MRVFLTGATGLIGSAIVPELINAGHQVIGLARSDAAAQSLKAAGAEVHLGSLDDLESLKSGAAKSDGVIHTAFIHAFSNISISARLKVLFGGLPNGIPKRFMSTIAALDSNAIAAMGSVLAGSNRPLVITSGTMILPIGHLVDEHDKPDSASPAAYRTPAENQALDLAGRGVRTSIVRLPPTVHGEGDKGFIPSLIGIARKKGVSAYVNEGKNHWPAVHRLDAAQLFRLALENGKAGDSYHGVAEQGVPFRDIAEIIGRKLDLALADRPRKHFGFLGDVVAADNPASSTLTKKSLNWKPTHPSLIQDLESGFYF